MLCNCDYNANTVSKKHLFRLNVLRTLTNKLFKWCLIYHDKLGSLLPSE